MQLFISEVINILLCGHREHVAAKTEFMYKVVIAHSKFLDRLTFVYFVALHFSF